MRKYLVEVEITETRTEWVETTAENAQDALDAVQTDFDNIGGIDATTVAVKLKR